MLSIVYLTYLLKRKAPHKEGLAKKIHYRQSAFVESQPVLQSVAGCSSIPVELHTKITSGKRGCANTLMQE
jgi:hypothetical protein